MMFPSVRHISDFEEGVSQSCQFQAFDKGLRSAVQFRTSSAPIPLAKTMMSLPDLFRLVLVFRREQDV